MSEFLDMGGYGVYVWSAVGLSIGVLAWNWISAHRQVSKVRQELAAWLREKEPS